MRFLGLTVRRTKDIQAESTHIDDFLTGKDLSNGNIGVNDAIRINTVYACVNLLTQSMASLPLQLFLRENDDLIKADYHPLYDLLHNQPNEELTHYKFFEKNIYEVLISGNSYNYIKKTDSRIIEIIPLKFENVTPKRNEQTGKIEYHYLEKDGRIKVYSADKILHFSGLGLDGVIGYSPIEIAAKSFELAINAEGFGNNFFKNGALPSSVLEHPGKVTDLEKIRKSWNVAFGGKNSGKTAVLEEGMTFKTISISPEQAQFLSTRKYQEIDICKIFRVPPHMIGILDKATFSNIEQQSLDFVIYTLRPWLINFEEAINKQLLSDEEKTVYFTKFNVDGLLRGDFKARMDGYAVGRQNGWLSANDIRRREDLPLIPDEEGGNEYLANGNMRTIKKLSEAAASNEGGNNNNGILGNQAKE